MNRQVSMVGVFLGILVLAAPVAAVGVTGGFASSTAAPAVAARNSSAANGAKAVLGSATAPRGATYGVYGSAASPQGYGVYSAGRLGIKGLLVCSKCVTAGDINPTRFPTVPSAQNATTLAGRPSSYFGHVASFSVSSPVGKNDLHVIGSYDGLDVGFRCEVPNVGQPPWVGFYLRASTVAADGTITMADYTGQPAPRGLLTTTWIQPTSQSAIAQPGGANAEAAALGTALYVNSRGSGVVTLTYSVDVDDTHCEVAGQLVGN